MTSHDIAHEHARDAVERWITTGDAKAGRELRDALHALSVAGNTRPATLRPGVMPKRRKVA